MYNLTIKIKGLRNSKGILKIALYNKEGSIPDEKFKNYFKITNEVIINNSVSYTFKNLVEGVYAVSILHDENKDGKIDRGFILPTEGVGFSNLKSINIMNRPNFSRTSFTLNKNKNIEIKIIYL